MLELIEKKVALGDGVVVRKKASRPRLPLDAFAIPADRIEVFRATARPQSELVETCPEWRLLPRVRLVRRWVRQLPVGDHGHGAQNCLGLDRVTQWCRPGFRDGCRRRWRLWWKGRATAGEPSLSSEHERGRGGPGSCCHGLRSGTGCL